VEVDFLMSDADPKQPSFEIQTTAGKVHVDADDEEAAAMIARAQVGGNVMSVEQASGKKASAAKAAEAASPE
jgi:hypothetical protein